MKNIFFAVFRAVRGFYNGLVQAQYIAALTEADDYKSARSLAKKAYNKKKS